MARYTGPKTKIARKFGEPIFGPDKYLERKNYPPGQHGQTRSRSRDKFSEYGQQLKEKQKVKYTYGLLERQFRNLYEKASRMKGRKGENLIILLESRLDNTVYRMGLAPSRPAARQLVSHRHITVNGKVCNIPSAILTPATWWQFASVQKNWKLSRTLSVRYRKAASRGWNGTAKNCRQDFSPVPTVQKYRKR